MSGRELLHSLIALLRRATPRTKVKLLLFAIARVIRRATAGRITLYQGGIFEFDFGRFHVDQGHGHLGTLSEIFGGRIYQRPGFIPFDGETCVDCGANIGCVTVLWRGTNPGGSIIAVEPHPQTVATLRENVALNLGATHTVVEHAAIGATAGEIELVIDAGGQSMARHPSRMSAEDFDGQLRIKVPSLTIDALCAKHGIARVDLLKIDVEGFESDALAGAAAILPRTDRVMLEYHSEPLRMSCRAVLEQAGFVVGDVPPLLFAARTGATRLAR
jgi:FkbM family methyltransferase